MKRTLLCIFLGIIPLIVCAQYNGYTDAERSSMDRLRTQQKVKLKTVQSKSIDSETGKITFGDLSYEKFNESGFLIENGTIVDAVYQGCLKRYFNENNDLIKQEYYQENNRLSSIRYWEYDSLGHVVFEKDSSINYRSKNLVTEYQLLGDSSILGITTGYEKKYVQGNVSERMITSTYILYQNNDQKITRGTTSADGTMGDSGTVIEYNEKGERVKYAHCSRQVLNSVAGNYCSVDTWIYNDEGLIIRTESKNAKGRKSREANHYWFTYDVDNQLIEVKTERYGYVTRTKFERNSMGQPIKLQFVKEQLSTDYNYETVFSYNSRGLLIKEEHYPLNTLKLNGEVNYTYEYFDE